MFEFEAARVGMHLKIIFYTNAMKGQSNLNLQIQKHFNEPCQCNPAFKTRVEKQVYF